MILYNVKRAILIITGTAVVAAGIFSLIFHLTFLETITFAQALFSALALVYIIYNLHVSLVGLNKAMAKPSIKVAFNEKGEQQTTLTFKDGKAEAGLPHPWFINHGNAVARYFQIDVVIPESIAQPGPYIPLRKENGNYVLSYMNEGRFTLFVNRPYRDPNIIFSSAINIKKCLEVYKDSFEINYKVYGDWAETQEGKLKVNLVKQESINAKPKS
jgi:hypothetical protein